ncbi:hypothetical protein [Streptomyces sp. ITFR-6]|uniref:hypothetical protein n=1 Tax=Streptomyces sp. ITFR-6 TaxID=3075197 RepID=UPI00288A311C|nr:hypothetical protein [Streptomyces sp. ITFR-6]WNI34366.1 hypothetical protein RLT59_28360 [Streptomyces sp. ITFR-6]
MTPSNNADAVARKIFKARMEPSLRVDEIATPMKYHAPTRGNTAGAEEWKTTEDALREIADCRKK